MAAAKFRVSWCIRHRRSRTFCMVIASIGCLEIPYGTLLGVKRVTGSPGQCGSDRGFIGRAANVAQGPRSGPAALPATRVLAASQTGQSGLGLDPHRIRFPRTYGPRRQKHGTVEEPQGWRASLALHSLSAAWCKHRPPLRLAGLQASLAVQFIPCHACAGCSSQGRSSS
jgi:hypothetical protein